MSANPTLLGLLVLIVIGHRKRRGKFGHQMEAGGTKIKAQILFNLMRCIVRKTLTVYLAAPNKPRALLGLSLAIAQKEPAGLRIAECDVDTRENKVLLGPL